MTTPFHQRAVEVLRAIPKGKVATYGQVAALAGNHRAARQIARILHSSSETEKLPWHRVLGRNGRISLKPGQGFEVQAALLKREGVRFRGDGSVDLERYGWQGS